jgi:hypothetical protein
VLVKLVDPVDGKVLGRARKLGMPSAGRMENLFAEDGKRFKELFLSTGKGLLAKAMKDLDLLPK